MFSCWSSFFPFVSAKITTLTFGLNFREHYTIAVSGSGGISTTISNLMPNTQYQYRTFCATNDDCGMTYGEEKYFTTQSINVTTNNASDVTQTHATLNGSLNIGDANISSQGFEYKKSSDNEWQSVSVSGSGDISKTLSDLTPSTQYRFRTFCTPVGCETVYGQEKTFNTLAVSVITNDATNITQTHATLHGMIDEGDAYIIERGFEYKKASDAVWQTVNVYWSGSISSTLSNLTPDTHYHFRAFCSLGNGNTIYGNDLSFYTLEIIIITYEPTNLTERSVTLNGCIGGDVASYTTKGFLYWKEDNPNYCYYWDVENTGNISVTLYDLDINTTYCYQTYARIGDHNYVGDDKYFQISWLNSDTIYIYDKETFEWIVEKCNDGVTFQNKYIKLMTNIEMPENQPNNITTIGSYPAHPFKGTFDGNGKCISNISIDQTNSHYQGLFGYTQNAGILNLRIDNATINGRNYCGGLVGYAENTNIHDCCITNSLMQTHNNSGGLVGYQEQGNNSMISGCYSTCDINGSNYIGGLVGYSNYSTIRNSYVAGYVSGQGNAVGGIIGGATEVLMYNSYFNTEITEQDVAVGENNFKDGEGMTTAQMRDAQFVTAMNQGLVAPVWKSDYTPYSNNGFPILLWQHYGSEPCSAPNDLTYSVYNNTTIILNWDSDEDAEYYVVEYAIGDDTHHVINVVNNCVVINYYYSDITWRVKSVCAYGESGFVDGDNIIVGIDEVDDISKYIAVYPNPTKDFVNIKSDKDDITFQQIIVFDISGREVVFENVSGHVFTLNVSGLPKGVYIVRVVTDENNVANLKLLVK